MNTRIICIICPNSCKVDISKNNTGYSVCGNRCKRGEAYAVSEVTHPTRTLTTTVKTIFPEQLFIPVKTAGAIDKYKRFELMQKLSSILVTEKLKTGDVVLKDFHGIDIVSCCDMTMKYI